MCMSQAVEKSSVPRRFCLERIPSQQSVCPCKMSGKKHATTNKTGSSKKSDMDIMNFPAARSTSCHTCQETVPAQTEPGKAANGSGFSIVMQQSAMTYLKSMAGSAKWKGHVTCQALTYC